MNVSCLTTIILALVGFAKTPFKSFKEKHKGWYRMVFFVLSIVLVVVGSIISELFILGGKLASVEFTLLLLGTLAGVLGGYSAYESLPIKTYVHKLIDSFILWIKKHPDSKVNKFLKKYDWDKIVEVHEKQCEQLKTAEAQVKDQTPIVSTPMVAEVVIEEKEEL